jgi:ABC-type glutathione transport system ATPase component
MSLAHTTTAPLALLHVCGVSKEYRVHHGMLRRNGMVRAVEDVSLTLAAGTTTAIVGQSGAGKSTLARCIAGLEQPTSGQIWIRHSEPAAASKRERPAIARDVQLIFQDSATALNPHFTAGEIIAEPLVIQGVYPVEIAQRVAQLLCAVGLPPAIAIRRPRQLSGGERQRLAIARALALEPSLLILDEAFSGLDLPIQRRILNLLRQLERQFGLTYLAISHDLRLMAAIADVIAIMYQGRIVEQGATRTILTNPQHPHTRALLNAIPGRALVAWRN